MAMQWLRMHMADLVPLGHPELRRWAGGNGSGCWRWCGAYGRWTWR